MSKRKQQSILYGAVILTFGTFIVKIIGALYKIPLTNLIGAVGFGYFNTAYTIFNPVYAFAVSGLSRAVSKCVSESVAQRRFREAKRTFRVSLYMFLTVGAVAFLAMAYLARPISRAVGNEKAYLAVLALAPAVFFCAIVSVYRGYFEGMKNMFPTAVSQIFEALSKLIFGLIFSIIIYHLGMSEFASKGTVFSQAVSTSDQAQMAVLPFSAAGAVLGVTLGTLFSAGYLWLRYTFGKDRLSKTELTLDRSDASSGALAKRLVKIAVPVCLGALIINLASVIDLVTVMNFIGSAVRKNPQAILDYFHGLWPEGMKLADIPNYLFGASAMAVTLFNLVPAVVAGIGVSTLPNISSYWAVRRVDALQRGISSALRITFLFAFPAGLGLFAIGGPILKLIYASRANETAIAAPVMTILGLAAVFAAVSVLASSILQGIGKANLPVKFMLAGAAVKLICNLVLIPIPSINIKGTAYGTLFCYMLISVCSVIAIVRIAKIKFSFVSILLKPLVCGAVSAAAARVTYDLAARFFSNSLSVIIALFSAVIIYLAMVILMRAVTKEEIKMLPKSEKIIKGLEKIKAIG